MNGTLQRHKMSSLLFLSCHILIPVWCCLLYNHVSRALHALIHYYITPFLIKNKTITGIYNISMIIVCRLSKAVWFTSHFVRSS